MKKIKDVLSYIKHKLWLQAVWFVRILCSKSHMKVPITKAIYYSIFGGFTKDQIALYDLIKENKKEYLSEFDWYKSRRINYPNSYMLNNKLICNNLLKDLIKIPKTIIEKEKNKEIDIEKTLEIIKKEKSTFFKPISRGKGIGIFRIDYEDNKFYIDFKETKEEYIKKLLKEKDNYFISSCIKQANYLNKIYDKTSNTIRLITAKDENKIKILFAVQRIGTKETIPVDNGSRGGLIAKIDLETGMLTSARSIQNKKEYKMHPDSNNPIENVTIPNWDKIKKQMIKTAEKLPQFKFIAWDLLITEEDLYVIEANSSSGVNILQLWGGQRNKELGDFYRKNKIIK